MLDIVPSSSQPSNLLFPNTSTSGNSQPSTDAISLLVALHLTSCNYVYRITPTIHTPLFEVFPSNFWFIVLKLENTNNKVILPHNFLAKEFISLMLIPNSILQMEAPDLCLVLQCWSCIVLISSGLSITLLWNPPKTTSSVITNFLQWETFQYLWEGSTTQVLQIVRQYTI